MNRIVRTILIAVEFARFFFRSQPQLSEWVRSGSIQSVAAFPNQDGTQNGHEPQKLSIRGVAKPTLTCGFTWSG